jgi:DNA primase (bacterial type)
VNARAAIDVEAIQASADLVEVVRHYVPGLKKRGNEWVGLCPFHVEDTASFHVIPRKGYVHCFGCGAHEDAVGFIRRLTGCTFVEACEQLSGQRFAAARDDVRVADPAPLEGTWVPLTPVPASAPDLMASNGWTVKIWNPKSSKLRAMKPTRVDAYRDADGRLLGYVLRADIKDRDTGKVKKWTPTVTWCVGPDGKRQWCLQHFRDPRPLCGLDDLAARPDAPVLIVEGEKCRAAGAGAWPQYVVLCWPGGSNGIGKVDWSPLKGRDVTLWPDADAAGIKAMLGWRNDAGDYRPGVAAFASRAGVRSLRMVDTAGQPNGWDVADALEVDGWTPRQLAAWAAERVIDVTVMRG